MVDEFRRMWQLWGFYARLDLTWFLRDTKYCLGCVLGDTVSALSTVAGVFLLAERFGDIGGMTADQILFMLGYATLVDGVLCVFFGMNNVAWISRLIGRGQLDHRLIQPVPLWMQLATEGFIPISGNSVLLCGLWITWVAIGRLGIEVGAVWTIGLIASVGCSVAVILSCSYIAGSLAFYAPVAGEEISTSAIALFDTLKAFPIGGLSLTARIILTTAVPVGLVAWFPANVLQGRVPAGLPSGLFIVMTLTLALVASAFFRKGMRHYARNGSIRYDARGHRR